ncbi:hypothetical protein V8G54_022039, partial [Vigna mungo]
VESLSKTTGDYLRAFIFVWSWWEKPSPGLYDSKGRGRTVIHGATSYKVSNGGFDDWPQRRRGVKEQRRFSLRELTSGVKLSEEGGESRFSEFLNEAMASETLRRRHIGRRGGSRARSQRKE